MKNYIIAAALGIGSLAIPFIASAQSYGYGPSSVINAWTAGIPLVTYGFGNAYGAPASAYMGYQDNYYGGYNSGSYYGQGGYYNPSAYYPANIASQFYPQGYNYQPYYSAYNQPYLPQMQTASIGSMYGGYGNGGYGYF